MADEPLVMGTERANIFQTKIQDELSRRGYDADQVMAEYIAIMVINKKSADQINAELIDLIGPDYNPDFSTWLFNTAKASPAAPKPLPPPPTPASRQPRLVTQAIGAATGASTTGTKRSLSPANGGPNKARKVDAPSAPRAMRDESIEPSLPPKANGLSGIAGKSLLDRMGGRPQRIETYDSRDSGFHSHRDPRDGGDRQHGDRRPFRNQHHPQNQNQNIPIPSTFVDPAFMMDPMMMGMGMNPMALQEMIGSNLAMMQQMANMMGMMQQQQQPPPRPSNSAPVPQGAPAPPTPVAAPTPLQATAAPFVPSVSVPDRPPSPTLCKYGPKCTNVLCRWSHPSPVATPESGIVLSTEVCGNGPGGAQCQDMDCTKSHISPAVAKPGTNVTFVSAPTSSSAAPAPTSTSDATSTPSAAPAAPARPTTNFTSAAPPQIPCKFGVHCTRPNCHFQHPSGRVNPGIPPKSYHTPSYGSAPCRFGAKCTRVDCTFTHPPGRTLPSQFHKGLSTDTKPSEAFQPAPHRTVVFNVPKKKTDIAVITPLSGIDEKAKDKAEEKEVEQVVKEAVIV